MSNHNDKNQRRGKKETNKPISLNLLYFASFCVSCVRLFGFVWLDSIEFSQAKRPNEGKRQALPAYTKQQNNNNLSRKEGSKSKIKTQVFWDPSRKVADTVEEWNVASWFLPISPFVVLGSRTLAVAHSRSRSRSLCVSKRQYSYKAAKKRNSRSSLLCRPNERLTDDESLFPPWLVSWMVRRRSDRQRPRVEIASTLSPQLVACALSLSGKTTFFLFVPDKKQRGGVSSLITPTTPKRPRPFRVYFTYIRTTPPRRARRAETMMMMAGGAGGTHTMIIHLVGD